MGEVRLDNAFGLNRYVRYFANEDRVSSPGTIFVDGRHFQDRNSDTYRQIAALDNNTNNIDTTLEFALMSYFTATVNSRPVQATEILPANSRQSELKLGAALFQEIQVLRFLADTNAVGRYEGMLKFITDRGNVTRAEIETHFRNGIRGLVNEIVNEEFNRVSFFIRNVIGQTANSYNGVLTRNAQTGHYALRYEDSRNVTKELSAASLEALLSAMSGSGDFSQAAINEVRAQAALIPAVVYAGWRPGGVDAITLITETLTNFYLNPNQTTYGAVLGILARYSVLAMLGDNFAYKARDSYMASVRTLDPALLRKLTNDADPQAITALARIPNDARFNVFAERYGAR